VPNGITKGGAIFFVIISIAIFNLRWLFTKKFEEPSFSCYSHCPFSSKKTEKRNYSIEK